MRSGEFLEGVKSSGHSMTGLLSLTLYYWMEHKLSGPIIISYHHGSKLRKEITCELNSTLGRKWLFFRVRQGGQTFKIMGI